MRRIGTAVLLALFLALSVASGQNVTTRVFPLKYADVNQASQVLAAFGVPITADRNLKVLAVRGTPDLLDAIGEAIKRLDVPPSIPHNIEMTVYMMMAAMKDTSGIDVPKELDPVIKQMRLLFPYKEYRLVETALIRVRDGNGGSVSGMMPKLSDSPASTTYSLRVGSAGVGSETKDRAIRINNLRLDLKVPVRRRAGDNNDYFMSDAAISTDVDIREGQKVVVGKAGLDGSEGALILVLTAKVLD